MDEQNWPVIVLVAVAACSGLVPWLIDRFTGGVQKSDNLAHLHTCVHRIMEEQKQFRTQFSESFRRIYRKLETNREEMHGWQVNMEKRVARLEGIQEERDRARAA